MKTSIITALAAIFIFSSNLFAESPDSLGLPGDGLNLQATLNLFKESDSPEEFEKKLNNKDNRINNLDLNKDGKVDYIRVHNISKDNVHVLVLQVPVNEKESQDVAVIEMEKRGSESVALQIVGDPELYGEEYTVQPKPEEGKSSGTDDHWNRFSNSQVVFVNVWYWPCVHYMYAPTYSVWISPWYYGYYPAWWYPWTPYPFYTYYGWTYVYYDYYYCCDPVYVLPNAHDVYQPRRVVSQSVQQGNRNAKNNRTTVQPNATPQQRGTPTEVQRDQSQPVPQATPAPPQQRGDVQPAPVPQQRPQPRPDVRPSPTPVPRSSPVPRPVPAPRPAPTSRPR